MRIAHLRALDGLRGLAVAAVVIYHLSPQTLPGGFLGVDVFFVLSGFLITSLLLSEVAARGRVALGTFYTRRLRRLAPALMLLVAALAVYSALVAEAAELGRLRSHGLASLLWVANWQFILDDTSYTEALTGASPLRHMWSLAIEEQFYVLFPLLLIVAVALARRTGVELRVLVGVAAVVGAVASAVWMAMLYDPAGGIERAYFGTDTHAHGILLGVGLGAVLVGRPPTEGRPARWLAVAAVPAALVVLGAFVLAEESADWMYRGGFAALGLAVVVLIAAVQCTGWLRAGLSWKPLVGLGLISYGVYLWHWPVIVVVNPQRTGISGVALMALQLAITLAVSLASYFLLERPVRAGALGRRMGRLAVLATPAAVIVLATVLVVGTAGPSPTVTAQAPPATQPEQVVEVEPEMGAMQDRLPPEPPVSLVVIGDSVAHTLVGGVVGANLDFEPWEPEQSPFDPDEVRSWSVAKPACSFLPGRVLRPGQLVGDGVDLSPACGDWRGDLAAAVEARSADYVLVALANDSQDRLVEGDFVEVGTQQWQEMLEEFLAEVRTVAEAAQAQTVLLELPPRVGSFADPEEPGRRERAVGETMARYAGEHQEVVALDLGEVVCPDGNCAEPDEGFEEAWRYDGMHYDAQGAGWFANWLTAQLLG